MSEITSLKLEPFIKLKADKFAYLKVKEWPPSKFSIKKLSPEIINKIKNEKTNI